MFINNKLFMLYILVITAIALKIAAINKYKNKNFSAFAQCLNDIILATIGKSM